MTSPAIMAGRYHRSITPSRCRRHVARRLRRRLRRSCARCHRSRRARAAPVPARGSVVAKVGRSGVNKFTGEPEWVEISDAAAAIEDAQAQYEAKDFAAAVKTLEGALKMSGSGVRRDRAKPAELSLGEQQAVFYIPCARTPSSATSIRPSPPSRRCCAPATAARSSTGLARPTRTTSGSCATGTSRRRARTHDSSRWWTGTTSSPASCSSSSIPARRDGDAMKMWGSKK